MKAQTLIRNALAVIVSLLFYAAAFGQDSLNVRLIGQISYPHLWCANDVAVNGNYAYIAGGDSLRVLNVSNPASPVGIRTLSYNWR